jgi:hypothetical protein
LKHLATFELQETVGVTGTIPDCFGLSSLTQFAVQGNRFSGPLPLSLCSSPNLKYLIVARNRLVGAFDPCFARLEQLTYLELDGNSLGGTVPAEVLNMPTLEILLLYDNKFTGPVEVGPSLTSMSDLDLSLNQLTGTLSSNVCVAHETLQFLLFSTNSLSGTLPPCLGSLRNLIWLEVSMNYFEGALNPNLCNLQRLTFFEVFDNHFSGTLPPCIGTVSLAVIDDRCASEVCNILTIALLYSFRPFLNWSSCISKTMISRVLCLPFGTSPPSLVSLFQITRALAVNFPRPSSTSEATRTMLAVIMIIDFQPFAISSWKGPVFTVPFQRPSAARLN